MPALTCTALTLQGRCDSCASRAFGTQFPLSSGICFKKNLFNTCCSFPFQNLFNYISLQVTTAFMEITNEGDGYYPSNSSEEVSGQITPKKLCLYIVHHKKTPCNFFQVFPLIKEALFTLLTFFPKTLKNFLGRFAIRSE